MTEKNAVNIPTGQALKLENLVEYSPGSVVSKTILKRGKGNLTLFAFDEGEGLSEHTAPFDAVVTILDGSSEITIGGEKLIAKTGETVVMPANVPHALHAGEPFKMLLVMIRE